MGLIPCPVQFKCCASICIHIWWFCEYCEFWKVLRYLVSLFM